MSTEKLYVAFPPSGLRLGGYNWVPPGGKQEMEHLELNQKAMKPVLRNI
jgi:hypothetical protein